MPDIESKMCDERRAGNYSDLGLEPARPKASAPSRLAQADKSYALLNMGAGRDRLEWFAEVPSEHLIGPSKLTDGITYCRH